MFGERRMGAWIETGPDAWQWSPDHDFGEQEKFPRHKYKSKFHKGKLIMEPDQFNNKAQKHKAETSSNTGRSSVSFHKNLKVGFVKYPEKGPAQMMAILNVLDKDFQGSAAIGDLWEKLEGVIITKQPVEKIYKHYHRKMVDEGYISILS